MQELCASASMQMADGKTNLGKGRGGTEEQIAPMPPHSQNPLESVIYNLHGSSFVR